MESLPRVTEATLDVLEALLGSDDELYGYKISQLAERKTGVVYPILDRLEHAGWIDSEWERVDRGDRGPRRRFYRLNADGLHAARALLTERRGGARARTASPSPRPLGRPGTIWSLLAAWGSR